MNVHRNDIEIISARVFAFQDILYILRDGVRVE